MKNVDLSSKTFSEFVEFLFARDVIREEEQWDCFLTDPSGQRYDEAVASSPETLIEYMAKLFSEFGRIAPKYSLAQVNQGVWEILGGQLKLCELLWEASVPLSKRLQCIRSMYCVYSDFVAPSKAEVMENCFDMWWDLILHNFWFQAKLFRTGTQMGDVSKLDSESRILLDVMFETIKRILDLPDPRTQGHALHGLGHLHHPAVRETVQDFIDRNKSNFTDERLRWLEECRDGTVM